VNSAPAVPARAARRLLCGLAALALLAGGAACATAPARNGAGAADAVLRAAHDAAAAGDIDRLASLAPQLAGQPLEAYGPYWLATARLHAPVPDDSGVRPFLARYAGTVLADRLRADWLLYLGGKGDLATFEAERHRLVYSGDDAQISCYAQLAHYALDDGHRREALARDARRFLALATDPGSDGCSALADRLLDDGALSIWPRLQALIERSQNSVAERTAQRLGPAPAAEFKKLLAKPEPWLQATLAAGKVTAYPDRPLALLALVALGRDDPEAAAGYAATLDPGFSPEERALVWGRLGRSGQLKLVAAAHDWFARGGDLVGVGLDYVRAGEVLEARARAALRDGSIAPAGAAAGSGPAGHPDWDDLRQTIAQMPPELQSDSTWIYWNAQALLAQGRGEEGRAALRSIAGRFGYYGRLAAEQLHLPVDLPPRPEAADAARIEELAQRPGFQRARRLFELGLRDEATREWNWELRGMNDAGLHAAAELGRRLGVLDRMIASSERMRYVVDLGQRYPMPYPEMMTATSAPLGMDPAWIYGLIRQESRFMEDIHSNAGAVGLMQIMPATARYVAHRIGFENYRNDRIADVGVNLRLGSEYLKMVLDDQDGQPLLASAAYNSGPNRVRHWRAGLAHPLDGAIFVETIPIHETRDYVKKVLFNTVVYGALLQRPLPLQALLEPVTPKALPDTELP
jgi:soluble lytic murein transglycosylase